MLKKLIWMSLLIATIAVPMYAARHPSATRGLRGTVVGMVVVVFLYVFSILHVVPRLP